MSNLKEKLAKGGVTAVIVITIFFGLTFKWSIATGIWLIICILRSVFNVTVKK